MYRRILVPVDGSAASLKGLEQAIRLARSHRAQLRVLNVVDDFALAPMMMEPEAAAEIPDVVASMRADGRRTLEAAVATARKRGVKAQAKQVDSVSRPVSEAILADARRSRADVIVMGTHGRRGLNRLLLGSDAERVLRGTSIPVLLTRLDGAKPPPAARKRTKSHA